MRTARLALLALCATILPSVFARAENRYDTLARESAAVVLPAGDAEDRSPLSTEERRIVRYLYPEMRSHGPYQYPRWAPRLILWLKRPAPAPQAATPDTTVGPNVNVSNRGGAQSESFITLDFAAPSFIAAASNDMAANNQCQFASSDSGATWIYRPMPLGSRSFHSDPGVAYDSAGNLYAVSLGVTPSTAIQISKSTDRGLSFGSPVEADVNAGNDKELIVADYQPSSPCKDNLYVAWDRYTTGVALVTRSTNGGANWSTQTLGSSNWTGACPAVGPNGEVYVAYEDSNPNRISVWKSTDCGASFTGPTQIAPTSASYDIGIPAMCNRRAFIYAIIDVDRSSGPRRGWVYASWIDGVEGGAGCAGGQSDVKFSRSTDGGATWSSPIDVHEPLPASSQFNPWLSVDPVSGDIHVMYDDTRDDPAQLKTHIYVNRSTDGGSTFSASVRVTTAQTDETCCGADTSMQYGDYNGLVANNGLSYPVWTDRRTGGSEEIYTAQVNDQGGGAPTAAFTGSPTSGPAPLTVAFTDQSTGGPTSWSWDFGDSGTSTAQNPSHVYTSVGSYTVALTACNGIGCNSLSKPSYITVTGSGAAAEIVTGDGYGPTNPPEVKIWDHSNPPNATATFAPYGAGGYGCNAATANLNNAGFIEILTGPGPGGVYGPQVRGFASNGTAMGKINYYAYGTLRYGVNVERANVDADAYDEILTGAGPGAVFGPHVRGWNFDNASIASINGISFYAYFTLKYGVNVAGGDVDGDGYGEILTGPGPGGVFAPTVRGFNKDGGPLTAIAKINYNAFAVTSMGARVSAPDVDADGYSEIASGKGPGSSLDAEARVHDYDGASIALLFSVNPYPTLFYGAHPGGGDYNGDGDEELLASPGPGSANQASVTGYHWDGTTATVTVPTFSAHGYPYGANPTAGDAN